MATEKDNNSGRKGYPEEFLQAIPWREKIIARKKMENAQKISDRWDMLSSSFELSEDDRALIEPLLLAGTSDKDIYKYISDLRASHQDEDKNSLSAQIAQQRANGLNPDLTGAGEFQPMETPQFEPMPSQGGNGTNRGRAASFIGSLLQVASFGLDAYGVISGALAKEGLKVAGVAAEDIASAVGDESGKVADVDAFIAQKVKEHGFSGRKAKQYARYVAGRINAVPAALQRLKNQGDFQAAQSRMRLETFKNSAPFLADAMKAMKGAQDLLISTQELDLKEKKMKMEFLQKHPEYTEETLNAELAQKQEVARKASADADLAVENVTGAQLDNAGKRLDNAGKQIQNATDQERLTQMQDDNETRSAQNEVRRLKSDLERIELEGIDKMLEFCRAFEEVESRRRQNFWNPYQESQEFKKAVGVSNFYKARDIYNRYQKAIKKYYKDYRNGKTKVSLSTPVGGASFEK